MNQISKKKNWIYRESKFGDVTKEEREKSISEIAAAFNIPVSCAALMYDRGCGDTNAAAAFIHSNYISGRDPFLIRDMDKAVERINRAIESGNDKICIFGDYDVDGVTSVSLMYLYLISRGLKVGYYIPKRSEGYGMSCDSVDMLKERGVTLIITVDTGISSIDEIEYANSLGIDTVVTDHHECRPELPAAVAMVNPHRPDDDYPFKDLAGVGVAYKLISALEMDAALKKGTDRYDAERSVLLKYADLVAIGTIADVMPIIDENRMIVSYGLKKIRMTPRKGISALIDASSKRRDVDAEITASFIGFTIAPRLNAAGRMDSASIAVELLLSENEEKARDIATLLCDINIRRQQQENRIANEAMQKMEEDLSFCDDSVIVLADDNWQQGVIGIVASRLTEQYAKPTVLITFDDMSTPGLCSPLDIGKGSGRSVKGMNLVSALSYCGDLLVRYGGHELAAGFSVTRSNLPEFRRKINEYAKTQLGDIDFTVTIEADLNIRPDQITLDLAETIQRYVEPCGTGNPVPVFVMNDVKLISARPISEGKHTKLLVEKDGIRFQAIFFGVSPESLPFDPDDLVDIIFSLNINKYKGETSVQLTLSDIRYATSYYRRRLEDIHTLKKILSSEDEPVPADCVPDREDFINIFGVLNDMILGGRDSFSDQYIMYLMKKRLPPERAINYIKYKLLLEIFAELDLFKVSQSPCVSERNSSEWALPQDYVSVVRVYHPVKVDLESSAILQKLRRNAITEN